MICHLKYSVQFFISKVTRELINKQISCTEHFLTFVPFCQAISTWTPAKRSLNRSCESSCSCAYIAV